MKFEFNNVYITGAGGWLGKQLIEVLLSPDSNKAIKFSVSNNLKINAMVLPGENFANLYKESENVKVFNGDIRIDKEVKNFFTQNKKPPIYPSRINIGLFFKTFYSVFFAEINLSKSCRGSDCSYCCN